MGDLDLKQKVDKQICQQAGKTYRLDFANEIKKFDFK